MARRLTHRQADTVRAHIQGTKLVQRLQDHVLGDEPMTPTQVQAALALIAYVLPKPVQQVEQTGSLQISWAK